jgi:hypothetical protein
MIWIFWPEYWCPAECDGPGLYCIQAWLTSLNIDTETDMLVVLFDPGLSSVYNMASQEGGSVYCFIHRRAISLGLSLITGKF